MKKFLSALASGITAVVIFAMYLMGILHGFTLGKKSVEYLDRYRYRYTPGPGPRVRVSDDILRNKKVS